MGGPRPDVHRPLRAAVIGARGVGAAHIAALRTLPEVDVAAVAGSTPGSGREVAARLSIPLAAEHFSVLIADPGIDVIHVCTPNDSHALIATEALKAGKHVVCEKPLALNAAQAHDLVAHASRAGSVAVVGYNYRFTALVAQLRELVLGGAIGRVHGIRGTYLQNWMLSSRAKNWRNDPARGGPSAVMADVGTHLLDLVEFVTDSRITEALGDFEVEDQANLLLRMSSGAAAALAMSQVSAGHTNQLRLAVEGDRGSVEWSFDGREELRLVEAGAVAEIRVDTTVPESSNGRFWVAQPPPGASLQRLLAATYAAIGVADQPSNLPSFEDGLRHLRVIETACLRRPRGVLRPLDGSAFGAGSPDRTENQPTSSSGF